jgi:hypothetical protein
VYICDEERRLSFLFIPHALLLSFFLTTLPSLLCLQDGRIPTAPMHYTLQNTQLFIGICTHLWFALIYAIRDSCDVQSTWQCGKSDEMEGRIRFESYIMGSDVMWKNAIDCAGGGSG